MEGFNPIDKKRIIHVVENYERQPLPLGNYISGAMALAGKNWGHHAIMTLLLTLFVCLMPLLVPPIVAGWYLYLHLSHRNYEADLGVLSTGFRYYLPFLLQMLTYSLITVGTLVPIIMITEEFLSPEVGEIVGTMAILALTPLYYAVSTWLFFVPFFVLFGGMNFFAACKWSVRLANKNFWWLLLVVFVSSVIAWAGMNACYVGGLFSFPVSMAIHYLCFEDFFKEDLKADELDEVLRHLV